MDAAGHGTHIAGIIGAVGNNFTGITGVNWTASIMALKIASKPLLGSVVISDAIDAMEFAIQVKTIFAASATPANVRVLSNSWGGNPFSQALLDEINRTNAYEMLFVAAAGNQGQNMDVSPLYPASYNAPNVMSVAATDSTDALADFSNYGAGSVHLGAPGVSILSTTPGASYASISGTSQATPHVSGSAALLLSACSLNTAGLKSAILNNVDVIPSLTGKTVTGGRLNANKAIRSCVPSPPPPTPTPVVPNGAAQFSRVDTLTQGTWVGRYGADGYGIAGATINFPAYAKVWIPSAFGSTWASSTNDVRALQKGASAPDRIASIWYNSTSFFFDINLTDGISHQVALYLLDWDFSGRAERIDILDAVSGNVLDTRSLSDLPYGKYVVWNLAGHVQMRVTITGGPNAGASGIFFDIVGSAPPPGSTGAAFIKSDTTTQGSWKGQYGSQGYSIAADSRNYPAYAQVTALNTSTSIWTGSTTDVRALQKASSATDRIASAWYSSTYCCSANDTFTFDVNLTDGNHQVALYLLDWDSSGRAERIDILDTSGTVLDTRTAISFASGEYLVWNLQGHVQIQITHISGTDSVVSGIFFGGGSDFTIAASPGSQTVTIGAATDYTVTVAAANGFTGTVNLSVSGLPSGAVGSFSPAAVVGSGSATLSVAVSSATAAGTYQLIITGTSGGLVHTAVATLVVQAPTVQLAVNPSGATLHSGQTQQFTAIVTGTSNTAVTWSLSPNIGSISATGLYTAPAVISGVQAVGITAISQADSSKAVTVTVTLTPQASAQFLGTDTISQGTWKGDYGTDGFQIANDVTSLPAYAQVTMAGQASYTWASPTNDTRALQQGTGSSRIGSCWYSSTSFTVDINLTDGQSHTVALYMVDWENAGRTERIDIVDANSGLLLDSRTVSSFIGGQYLTWTLTGHVNVRVTRTGGNNGVLSGLFFGQAAIAPQITQQPQNAAISIGQSATFNVVASGSGLIYQWQSKPAASSNFSNIAGATASSFTTGAAQLSDSGTQFRCTVSNSNGSVSSSAATLTIVQASAFVTPIAFGAVRNDYSGWVGMTILTGSSGLTITDLGRFVLSGNSASHVVKLVNADTGLDVPGGMVTISTSGAPRGSFVYTSLGTPITLNANAVYYVMSQETSGGDSWYDYNNTLVQTTSVATVTSAVYGDGSSYVIAGLPRQTYGPVDFRYR